MSEGKKIFKPLQIDVVPDEGLWLEICNQPDDIDEQVANGREFEVDEMITFIEKSAAEVRDSTLRCMQQILKANGSMTYKEFLVNLDGCGMTEDQIGELGV